jgi:CheY-like chemotaxis protein
MEKFKVIIVEDVKLELKGTEEIFRHEIPNAEVIGTAMTEAEFWPLLEQHTPDLILLDLGLVTPVGISFEDVTVESLKAAGIRGSIIKKIKQANNYQGSKMQKAIEAYEALNNGEDVQGSQEQSTVVPKQPKPTSVPQEDFENLIPF